MNLLSIALFASFFAHISTADTEGSIQLYSDGDCTAKGGGPILTPHDLCIETNQTSSIYAISLPSCPNGHPVLYISDEESCREPSIQPGAQSGNVGDCLFLPTGSGIGSAAFVCIEKVTTVSDTQLPAPTTLKSIVSTTSTYAAESSVTSASSTSATSPGSDEGQSAPDFAGKMREIFCQQSGSGREPRREPRRRGYIQCRPCNATSILTHSIFFL